MNPLAEAPLIVEAPHVCPEDRPCPYVRCPNGCAGTHLVMFNQRDGSERVFKRSTAVAYHRDSPNHYIACLRFGWEAA